MAMRKAGSLDTTECVGSATPDNARAVIDRLAHEGGAESLHQMDAAPQSDHDISVDAAFYETIRQAESLATEPTPSISIAAHDPYHDSDAEANIHAWLSIYITSSNAFQTDVLDDAHTRVLDFDSAPCVTPGTQITTLHGQTDVIDLTPGRLILTRDNGFQELSKLRTWKLQPEDLAERPALTPIRIKAFALGQGRPSSDLLVSPEHRLMLADQIAGFDAHQEGVFVTARSLVDGAHVTFAPVSEVTYMLPTFVSPQTIYANGLAMVCPSEDQLSRSIQHGQDVALSASMTSIPAA